jgi:membrane protein YdbS with pleckstrin-like domain
MAGGDLSGLFPGEDEEPGAADNRVTQPIPAMAGRSGAGDSELASELSPAEVANLRRGGRGGRGQRPGSSRFGASPDEVATRFVAQYLFPTERFRGEWRKHWIHIALEYLIGAAVTFLLGLASGWFAKHNQSGLLGLAVLIWLVIMAFLGWRVADWYFDRFVLTNKRIMVVNGLVSRTVGMMPLVRVTDMKYTQSALGRMLNYGTFVVESAGLDQALRRVPHMRRPIEIYLRIVEEMYEPEAVEARMQRMTDEAADI